MQENKLQPIHDDMDANPVSLCSFMLYFMPMHEQSRTHSTTCRTPDNHSSNHSEYFMKIFQLLIIYFATSITQAYAKLNLSTTNTKPAHPPYVQLISRNGTSHLIKSILKTHSSENTPPLYTQEMRCGSEKSTEIINSPISLYILPSFAQTTQYRPLLVHMGHKGDSTILQLKKDLSMVSRTRPLSEMTLVRSIAASAKGYFIGGITEKDMPSLQHLSHDLQKSKPLKIQGNRQGEITALFESRGRIIGIINYYVEKISQQSIGSALRVYGATGNLLVEIPLNSTATTGIALKDGGLAISYWIGEQLYVEKRSENFGFLWRTKLHQRQNIASIFGKMVEVGKDIAWVGVNDRKLLVHRISQQDQSVHTSIDTESGVVASGNDFNYVHAYGNELHIVSADSRLKTDSGANRTEFCFIESRDF